MTANQAYFIMARMKTRVSTSLVAALFLIILGMGCSPQPESPPTVTPSLTWTPTPTATATPVFTPTPATNLFLEAAERAELYGDWDRALTGYDQAVAFALDPAEITRAELGRGRMLIASGQLAQAVQSLSSFISLDLGEGLLEAMLLRAEAQEQLGNYADAARDFSQAAGLAPAVVQDWIFEREGDAWSYAGFQVESLDAYQRALDALYDSLDYNLELKHARMLDRLGEKEAALERYRQIRARYPEPFVQAAMDFLSGKVLQWLGDEEGASAAFMHAVNEYPQMLDAYSSLESLLGMGVTVGDLIQGVVYFHADEFPAAQTTFERYILADPEGHLGIVHHYLALIYRSQGDYQSALDEWNLLIDTHPGDENIPLAWEQSVFTMWAYMDQYQAAWERSAAFPASQADHPRAGEFIFDAAVIAEIAGQLEIAVEYWTQVAEEYPAYEKAHEARFMSGIVHFRLGENAAALQAFQQALDLATTAAERAADQLWIGKTFIALGEVDRAHSAWQFAIGEDPAGYYGLRAGELLAGRAPFSSLGAPVRPADPVALRAEGDTWLRETFGLSPDLDLAGLGPEMADHPRILRGNTLWQIGAHALAKAEFNALRDEIAGNPEAMYRLMNHIVSLGLYQPAIYISADILALASLKDTPADAAPQYISTIRFGMYFDDLILAEAEQAGLDGLFVLSVARQESLFESFATSYAAARGLMQIIPSTGEYLAAKAGWPDDFTIDDLFRPVVSVHYGVLYLQEQRDLFDGDLYATLAAYNAGPGNSLAWRSLAQGDHDLFLEIVRIQQPQDYIRSIYWAFRQYQSLYLNN